MVFYYKNNISFVSILSNVEVYTVKNEGSSMSPSNPTLLREPQRGLRLFLPDPTIQVVVFEYFSDQPDPEVLT